jgi:hypothetical protein
MNNKLILTAAAAALAASSFAGGAAKAAVVTLDFQGSSSSANPGSTAIAINVFYNGGTDAGGASGTVFGVSFSIATFASTSQFTQPQFGISSSIAYMPATPLTFTSDMAFTSIAFDQFFFGPDNVVNVYSGANGTGTLLKTVTFGQNCFSTCTAVRQTLSFANALSVTISPNSNGTGIDNLAITMVPEPATWAMMISGFGLVGFAARKRRSATVTYA